MSWNPIAYECPCVVQVRTTWSENALPSFVAGGTKIACRRRPCTVAQPRGLTRAPGYQPGPLTIIASFRSGRGDAASTRCCGSVVVLEPTTQPRHERAH